MCLTRSPTLGLGCSLPLQLSPPLSKTHLNVPAQVVRPSSPRALSLVLTVLAERYGLLLMLTSCKVGASSERSTAARIHILSFATGYPGIPPGGPDRPQAAVKGVRPIDNSDIPFTPQCHPQAIEVRVAQQGVKAKWVRIELRKIETLPGGGVANTFFDFVGQSPINLWQSPNDEYSTLHTVSPLFYRPFRHSFDTPERFSIFHSDSGIHSSYNCPRERR